MQVQDLQKELRNNVREYGMYIALFIIMAIFTYTTKGVFISSRNIANLMNQTGYIAVLAVGITLVYSFVMTILILLALKFIMGLRTSEQGERVGLDLTDHRETGYTVLD